MVVFIFALVACLGAPVVLADTISEARFLASVDSTHPSSVVLDEAVAARRAHARTAGAFSNPVLAAEREAPGNVEQLTWTLSWVPPLDGRRSARVSLAEASLESALAHRAWSEVERRVELRAAFAAWAIAYQREAVLAAHIEQWRPLVERVSARAERGEESRLNARRLALATVEIEAAHVRARSERVQAEAAAAAWLRGSTGLSPVPPELPEVPDSLQVADHPRVRGRRHEVTEAEMRRREAGRFITFPELTAGWQTVDAPGASAEGWVFGAAWSVPLFDRQQGAKGEADAEMAASRARLILEESTVSMRVHAARAAYAALHDAATDATRATADAGEVVETAMRMLELGEGTVTDLLETLRTVLSAQQAALDLYAHALSAHRELELAAGRALSSPAGRNP